jgi:lysophospholipase L1-like esterase
MKKRIVFVGNSFVEGVGDDVSGGWTRRLAEELPPSWTAIHTGIGGDNIRSVLNRFSEDVLVHEPDVIVMEVGINDSRLRESLGNLNEVPPKEFVAGLESVNLFARQKRVLSVIIVGLTPVDERRTNPYKEDKAYVNREIRKYDRLLRKFARANKRQYVPIFRRFARSGGGERLTIDGVHPSPDGHKLIAAIMEPEIDKALARI